MVVEELEQQHAKAIASGDLMERVAQTVTRAVNVAHVLMEDVLVKASARLELQNLAVIVEQEHALAHADGGHAQEIKKLMA